MGKLWVGAYSPDMGGTATGVTAVEVNEDGTLTSLGEAVAMDSPSFLATHPTLPVVYAAGEASETFRAFAVVDDALVPFGEPWDAGNAVCHIAIDPEGRFASVACWGSGQILVFTLDESGAITGRTEAQASADPYAGVPESQMVAPRPDYAPRISRGHYSQFLPDGRVLTIDLGYDLARVWSYADGAYALDHEVVFPYGVGPRHVALHPNGTLFVISEYAVKVFTLARGEDGRYAIVSDSPVRTVPLQPGEYAAHLSLSDDGELLYATVRHSDVVAVLLVGDDGVTVTPVTDVPSGAAWPRHHLVDGGLLHVANQNGGEITTFALDEDGIPSAVVGRFATATPTVVLAR